MGALLHAARRVARAVRPLVTITAPPDGVVVEHDVEVRVRDGTILRVNVFRPARDGRFPVLMCAHPYGKDRLPRRRGARYAIPRQFRLLPQSVPFTVSAWAGWEAPDPGYWVPRGYVVVNGDLRGWGRSDGVGELLSRAGGRRLPRPDRVGGGTAVVDRQGRAERRLVPRDLAVGRGVAPPAAPRGDLPVGGLRRRVPRLRAARRRARGRVRHHVDRAAPAATPEPRRPARAATTPPALRRVVACARARRRARRGPRARVRQLLGPLPAQQRDVRGVRTHRLD